MALNDRNRRKHMAAAQKLLPNGTALGYAIGRSGANPVVVVAAMVGTSLAISVVLLVATGSIVIFGFLPMLIVQHYISPPRGIVAWPIFLIARQAARSAGVRRMNGKPLTEHLGPGVRGDPMARRRTHRMSAAGTRPTD